MSTALAPRDDQGPVALFLRNQRTPGTADSYGRELHTFAAHLGLGPDDLLRVTKPEILAYKEWMEHKGLAPSTIKRRLSVLRAFYAELKADGLIAHNPASGVKLPRKSRKRPIRALSLGEISAYFLVIPRGTEIGSRDYALSRIMLGNGARVSEVVAANVGDLSEELGHHVLWIGKAKNDEQRKLALTSPTYAAVLDYLGRRGFAPGQEIHGDWRRAPLFLPTRAGNFHGAEAHEPRLSARSIRYRLRTYGEQAGIDPSILFPHVFRRTCISWAIKSGADVRSVAAMAGHKSLMTTSQYADDVAGLDDNAAYKLPY